MLTREHGVEPVVPRESNLLEVLAQISAWICSLRMLSSYIQTVSHTLATSGFIIARVIRHSVGQTCTRIVRVQLLALDIKVVR